MKIFISYASEDRNLADRIQMALRASGYNVFFDRDRLRSGDYFHPQIIKAIRRCHAFLFLTSVDSVTPGCVPLLELQRARERWPYPRGKALPILAPGAPVEAIPSYLSGITAVEGDSEEHVVGNVLTAMERLRCRRKKKFLAIVAGVGLIGALLGIAFMKSPWEPRPTMQWGVVFCGDAALKDAKYEVEVAGPKFGVKGAVIYLRENSYRSVALFSRQEDANKALVLAKRRRDNSYVVEMPRWCPRWVQKDGYRECQSR
jgi:hypothetical protein